MRVYIDGDGVRHVSHLPDGENEYEEQFFKPARRPRFTERGYRMFWGGADINPKLYGEKAQKETHFSLDADRQDLATYRKCIDLDLGAVGICRGCQFLWAMSGGRLMQDIVPRHPSPHGVRGTVDFFVNSYHHQGCILTNGKPPDGLEVLATHGDIVEAYAGTNHDGVRVRNAA